MSAPSSSGRRGRKSWVDEQDHLVPMEGAGFMRLKQMCAIMLVPVATTWIGMGSVQAQVSSQSLPTSNATPLEFSGGPAVTPTAQGLDYRRIGGKAALKQLRNPFDGGTGQPQCSPQAPA